MECKRKCVPSLTRTAQSCVCTPARLVISANFLAAAPPAMSVSPAPRTRSKNIWARCNKDGRLDKHFGARSVEMSRATKTNTSAYKPARLRTGRANTGKHKAKASNDKNPFHGNTFVVL